MQGNLAPAALLASDAELDRRADARARRGRPGAGPRLQPRARHRARRPIRTRWRGSSTTSIAAPRAASARATAAQVTGVSTFEVGPARRAARRLRAGRSTPLAARFDRSGSALHLVSDRGRVPRRSGRGGLRSTPGSRRRARAAQDALSLYVHIPFCETALHLLRLPLHRHPHREVARTYLDYLAPRDRAPRRAPAAKPALAHPAAVGRRHADLPLPGRARGASRRDHAPIRTRSSPGAELAIEVDPRVTTRAHLETLARLGFNRLSMGVQDFTPAVQEAIGRHQTFARDARPRRGGARTRLRARGSTSTSSTACRSRTRRASSAISTALRRAAARPRGDVLLRLRALGQAAPAAHRRRDAPRRARSSSRSTSPPGSACSTPATSRSASTTSRCPATSSPAPRGERASTATSWATR